MNDESAWEEACEADTRSLFVGGAPPPSGEMARAVVELLWAMADAVDAEYATETERNRTRSMPMPPARWPDPEMPWRHGEPERQLTLDLGDGDFF